MTDRVKTPAGVKKYGAPIGSPITAKLRKNVGRTAQTRLATLGKPKAVAGRTTTTAKASLAKARNIAPTKKSAPTSTPAPRPDAKTPKRTPLDALKKATRKESNPYLPVKSEKGKGGTPTGPEPLTNVEYGMHTADVEAKVGKAMKEGKSTDKLYAVEDGGGNLLWDAERDKMHREVVDQIWAAQKADKVPNDGKALIAGGLGGAGKSTTLAKHADVDQSQYVTVNPDDVKELLADRGLMPKIEGLSPMETSALIHEESSHIAMMLAERAYAERKNIIWDITMSSGGSVAKRLDQLEANGYVEIDAVFVDIPVETSVQRALARHRNGMERHRNGTGQGGRYVPPSIIRQNKSDTHSSKNREVFESLQKRFSSYGIWDNSGKAPVKQEGTGRWA